MLTIENLDKIKQYSYDIQWTCDKIEVTDTQYEFLLVKRNIGGQICDFARITLHREPSMTNYKDGYTYPISLNTKMTNYIVTADFIKNINNLVNTFTEILGKQYKPI